jgi:hypothetical protein
MQKYRQAYERNAGQEDGMHNSIILADCEENDDRNTQGKATMQSSYRFVALPHERFAGLFELSDPALASQDARRMVVDEKPGYPCRVSLADAEVGETVLLLPFCHQDVSSPYRSSGPIFVRAKAKTANCEPGEIPIMFRHRQLSIRGYDSADMMIAAEVVMGSELDRVIPRIFANQKVSYLHIHNARPGCYNCRVDRL